MSVLYRTKLWLPLGGISVEGARIKGIADEWAPEIDADPQELRSEIKRAALAGRLDKVDGSPETGGRGFGILWTNDTQIVAQAAGPVPKLHGHCVEPSPDYWPLDPMTADELKARWALTPDLGITKAGALHFARLMQINPPSWWAVDPAVKVTAEVPIDAKSTEKPSRRRGPSPVTTNKVMEKIKAYRDEGNSTDGLKLVELEALFGAAASTCKVAMKRLDQQ